MKSSPIQLLESFPEKILLTISDSYDDKSTAGTFEKLDAQVFREIEDFPGFWETEPPVKGLEERTYNVTLGIRTPKGKSAGPYVFEFVISGVVVCVGSVGDRNPRDLAFEYGLTILYGNIREQFAGLTARMRPGIRFLPTLSFIGEKPSEPMVEEVKHKPQKLRAALRKKVETE